LKAIRNVNQLIVVERNRDHLLQKACDALIEARSYDATWLGFLKEGKTFSRVVGSGLGEEVSFLCERVMDDEPPLCIENALAQKDGLLVVDQSGACGDCFFRNACTDKQVAIIRLEHADRLFGVLAVLSAPDVAIDEEEKGLLEEVAGDIAIGLHNIELEETRLRGEEALRESEKMLRRERDRLRNIFETMDDGVYIVNRDYDIEYVNSVLTADFGPYEGRKCYAYFHDFEEACPWCKSQDVFSGKTVRWEWYSFRNGKTYDLIDTPLRNADGTISKLELFRDITKRKHMEEQIRRHNEELEELVQARMARIQELERQQVENEKLAAAGRMAARIAHEINNPLAGIKNSFLLIKDAIHEDYPYYEYVGRIEKEIDRIARIVRQMFDLYRPDREASREFPVDEAIRDVAALLEAGCREYEVILEVDTGDASASVVMPEPLVRQVLYNVLQNAIEASPPGGIVRIVVAVSENVLTLTIFDQGGGIPEEMGSQIFEPFFTTKSGLTTGGLGLGLSVSRNIVESLGGSLHFESTAGQGTVFNITLPFNRM
ncbi:MAG: hypothetical protein KAJ81_11480, partial [Candidatus Latescibacteria bacterium]|nr:hypothetical protein [Candidatus Latescibacterota bacterium]